MATAPSSRPYDTVVVGARVAGAATAMLLARAGHRVALVDRVKFPSDTLSTHLLQPAAHLLLHRWGLLDQVVASGAPATTVLQNAVDGWEFALPFPDPASGVAALHHPRRTVLDPILVGAAEAAGADVLDRMTVTSVRRAPTGRVVGIDGWTQDGQPVHVPATFVVGADGWRSRVARSVGAAAYDERGVVNSTHYAYWEGLDDRGLEVACSTDGLMAGVIPTNGGACVYVNCHPDRVAALRADPRAGYLAYLAEVAPELAARLATARRTSPVRGTPGIPNFKRRPWGPGWVLVGDAGYTKDPVSGHGITDAFVAAELAAAAIHRALAGAPEPDVFAEYHARRDELAADLYEVALAWGSYAWTAEELLGIQARFAACLTSEAQAVAAFEPWIPVPADAPEPDAPAGERDDPARTPGSAVA